MSKQKIRGLLWDLSGQTPEAEKLVHRGSEHRISDRSSEASEETPDWLKKSLARYEAPNKPALSKRPATDRANLPLIGAARGSLEEEDPVWRPKSFKRQERDILHSIGEQYIGGLEKKVATLSTRETPLDYLASPVRSVLEREAESAASTDDQAARARRLNRTLKPEGTIAKGLTRDEQMESRANEDLRHPGTFLTGLVEKAIGSTEVGRTALSGLQKATNVFGLPELADPEGYAARSSAYEPSTATGRFVAGAVGGLRIVPELALTGGLIPEASLGEQFMLQTALNQAPDVMTGKADPAHALLETGVAGLGGEAFEAAHTLLADHLLPGAQKALGTTFGTEAAERAASVITGATVMPTQTVLAGLVQGKLPGAEDIAGAAFGGAAFGFLGGGRREENGEGILPIEASPTEGERHATQGRNVERNRVAEYPNGDRSRPPAEAGSRNRPVEETGEQQAQQAQEEVTTNGKQRQPRPETESLRATRGQRPGDAGTQPQADDARIPGDRENRQDPAEGRSTRGPDRESDLGGESLRQEAARGNENEISRHAESAGGVGPADRTTESRTSESRAGESRASEDETDDEVAESNEVAESPSVPRFAPGEQRVDVLNPRGAVEHEAQDIVDIHTDESGRHYYKVDSFQFGEHWYPEEMLRASDMRASGGQDASQTTQGAVSRVPPPQSVRAQEREHREIVRNANPMSEREATLQFLAQGGGFRREDVQALIANDVQRQLGKNAGMLLQKMHKSDALSIDRFVHEELPNRLGVSREDWTHSRELDARNVVHGVVSEVRSRRHAQDLFIKEIAASADFSYSDENPQFMEAYRPEETSESSDQSEAIESSDLEPTGSLRSTVVPFQPQIEQVAKMFGRDAAEIYRKEVQPQIAGAVEGFRELGSQVRAVLAPSSAEGTEAFKGTMREKMAQLALDTERIDEATKAAAKAMNRMPSAMKLDYIDRMEHGVRQPTTELETVARAQRMQRDEWVKKVQDLGTGKLHSLIEDYFPHIWKNPKQAEEALTKFYGKRPFEGDKSFLKKRSIDYVKDGLALGLELVTENPIELMNIKVHQMQKYVMAHEVMQEAKSGGLVKFTRQASPDAGYTFIEDRGIGYAYGNPKQDVAPVVEKAVKDAGLTRSLDEVPEIREAIADAQTDVHGFVVLGRYEMPEEAARLINNYLSPGLRYKSSAFRGYLALANHMNQFQLGWSAFHLGFTTMDAITSRFALGLYQLAHGDVMEAGKSIVSAPVAPFTQLIEGNKIFKAYMRPGSMGEVYGDIVKQVVMAGGRAKMDQVYRTNAWDNMKAVWKDSAGPITKLVRSGFRLPFALTEKAAAPILEWVVPRTKLGAFSQLAKYEMERLGPEASVAEVRSALGKAWDSIDNRLGQLVYDNLFWDKSVKDLAMASVRSVGWNLGTFRELGGAGIDAARFVKNAVTRKEKAEFTHRMSYAVALPVVTGMVGAMTQYLLTGKGPEELKDYFYPKDGGTDESGQASRVSLPTYMKDVYAYSNDVRTGHYGRTLSHKLHPAIAAISEMLENKDYYGTEIRHADDPVLQQVVDYVQFGLKQFVPFAGLGIQRNIELEGLTAKALAPLIGVTPAPRDLNRTKDELILAEAKEASRPTGSRTKAQAERSQSRYELRRTARIDGPDKASELADQMLRESKLSEQDVENVSKTFDTPGYVRDFKAAKIETAIAAYEAATPDRRAEYIDIMVRKFGNAYKHRKNLTEERASFIERKAKELEGLPVAAQRQ